MDSLEAHNLATGLRGQVAVVTGAGRGIGAGVAAGLAGAGTAVGCVDIDATLAEGTATAIRDAGGSAVARAADVSQVEEIRCAVAGVTEELGGVTILVASAAIDEAVPFEQIDLPRWQRMIEVNLTGVFLSIQAVLPSMRAAGRGRIVVLGSNLAEKGGAGLAHYCAAKAGVHGLARALARELALAGIHVNVVAPGPTDTEMLRSLPQDWLKAKRAEVPLGRFADVSEIVPTVLLLASDAGSFYTGATMNVSGGDVIP